MAFELEDFTRTGSIGAGGALWMYTSDDNDSTILAANYFNGVYSSLRVGDIITTSSSTHLFFVKVTAIANRVVTHILDTNAGTATNRIDIQSASDFPAVLDGTVQYFIDGVIDMGTRSLEVPAGGLNLAGLDLNISKLTSSENNYTMFTSPVGGSGSVIGKDFSMEVTGTSSKVFDLTDATGFNSVEWARVNWNDCTSLGTLNGYRQGLEEGTGRFGGSPELCLEGTWIGGYRASISIVRSLAAGMTGSLFKAGAGFTMGSRFLTDLNVDLPALASLADFAPANFTKPSLFQLHGMLITRDGVTNVDDTNYCPNIDAPDKESDWQGNIGFHNTHVGGHLEVTTEVATVITTAGTFYPILGTVTTDHMEHFSNPSAWRMEHLAYSPHDFQFLGSLSIDGPANDIITVRIRKYDASATTTSTVHTQTRTINNLQGARDIAFFNITAIVDLDQGDYCYLDIANTSSTGNLTAEIESGFVLSTR